MANGFGGFSSFGFQSPSLSGYQTTDMGFPAPAPLGYAPVAPTVDPDISLNPEFSVPSPDFDNPFNNLAFNTPDISVQQSAIAAHNQNMQNLGIPTAINVTSLHGVPTSPNLGAIAMHGALLGTLANQAVVNDAMQALAQNMTAPLGPPEGYQDAFNAPMSLTDALNATLAAMNPTMTAPSEDADADSTAPGAPSGNDGDGDGDGDGGPSGSPGSGGVSGPGMGGIGSEGGGGGPSGGGPAGGPGEGGNASAAGEGGGGPSGSPGIGGVSGSGMGGIGSEGGGGGPSGGSSAGGPGEGGEGGEGGE